MQSYKQQILHVLSNFSGTCKNLKNTINCVPISHIFPELKWTLEFWLNIPKIVIIHSFMVSTMCSNNKYSLFFPEGWKERKTNEMTNKNFIMNEYAKLPNKLAKLEVEETRRLPLIQVIFTDYIYFRQIHLANLSYSHRI